MTIFEISYYSPSKWTKTGSRWKMDHQWCSGMSSR